MYIRSKHFDFTDDELELIFRLASEANDNLIDLEQKFPDAVPDIRIQHESSLLCSILDKIEGNGFLDYPY